MHRPLGTGANQPVQTGFKRVVSPSPTGRQASCSVMLLDNLNLISAALRIDCSAEASDAGDSVRISRTALSDKTSRLRPRHVVSKPGQTHEPEGLVEVREWIAAALASSGLVLEQ